MLAQTLSASILGVEGVPVRVEVDVAFGLPNLTIVGLAGNVVQEARERVRSAIRNTGYEVPARRITVNLAPADLPKQGTSYDLAIATGILAASGQVRAATDDTALIAELALDGALQPVAGAMALVAAAREAGIAAAIVAPGNLAEAASVPGIRVHSAVAFADAIAHLAGVRPLAVAEAPLAAGWSRPTGVPDLAEINGQPLARRALEIALAGRHNLVLCGPPGVGKTLFLRAAAALLPPLEDDEALEVSRIYSVAGLVDRRRPLLRNRPFRMPHHTISTQALVGGGPRVRPGEASLAHRGVLVLDEALQFRGDALDALRQPLEAGVVSIARVEGALSLPARFSLLAAFNPCPCGWYGATRHACSCEDAARRRYAARLSGPLRDRIDLWVVMDEPSGGRTPLTAGGVSVAAPPPDLGPVDPESDADRSALDRSSGPATHEASGIVAERICDAWQRQRRRQGGSNAELPASALARGDSFASPALTRLELSGQTFGLSPRRIHGTARVARTIADLEGVERVEDHHVREALLYGKANAA
jgi:magnesium chelatase family protein